MKTIKYSIIVLLLVFGLVSCQSVHVATDYDKTVNFDQYKTFAFYKPSIDKADISDLDKRRILRAIDSALMAKGLTKSSTPDLLVSIFTKATKNINVHENYYGWGFYGYGWPYHPYWGYGPFGRTNFNSTYTTTQGTLYINLIDAESKRLIWQGMGIGAITPYGNVNEKITHINTIVAAVMNHYPPGSMPKK